MLVTEILFNADSYPKAHNSHSFLDMNQINFQQNRFCIFNPSNLVTISTAQANLAKVTNTGLTSERHPHPITFYTGRPPVGIGIRQKRQYN